MKMKTIRCKICGKVIEGYSSKHVDYLLSQHNLKHKNDERKQNEKEERDNSKTDNWGMW